jgi:hypothetical protein
MPRQQTHRDEATTRVSAVSEKPSDRIDVDDLGTDTPSPTQLELRTGRSFFLGAQPDRDFVAVEKRVYRCENGGRNGGNRFTGR